MNGSTRALKFKAEAFRLGLVLCLISAPFGLVVALVAPMASDSGDAGNPAIIAFVVAAMIYLLLALACGVVALVIRRRTEGARPWICLVLPLINIMAAFAAVMAI
jgi:hypothetical protein